MKAAQEATAAVALQARYRGMCARRQTTAAAAVSVLRRTGRLPASSAEPVEVDLTADTSTAVETVEWRTLYDEEGEYRQPAAIALFCFCAKMTTTRITKISFLKWWACDHCRRPVLLQRAHSSDHLGPPSRRRCRHRHCCTNRNQVTDQCQRKPSTGSASTTQHVASVAGGSFAGRQ